MWDYTLKNGKMLRKAISDGDAAEVLHTLRTCYEEINEVMPDIFDEDDLDSCIDDIENELDNYENYENYDMTMSDVEDNVDYLLGKFYDICDDLNIWVGL